MLAGNLSGAPIPAALAYARHIGEACSSTFSGPLAYAIAYRETIRGERDKQWIAWNVVSFDGGRGLFQLTSSYPSDWSDPAANARYAVEHFLQPACEFWRVQMRLADDALVRCIAAEFNAGRGNALSGHMAGDVDRFTTNHYAADVLNQYHRLAAGHPPV